MGFRVAVHGTWLATTVLMPPLLSVLCVGLLLAPTPAASGPQSAPGEIVGHKIPVPGSKVEGTTAKLSEVEAAQKEILAAARKLAEDGTISLGGRGEAYV